MRLQLGTGNRLRAGWINVDKLPLLGVDVIHDLDIFPYPFKSNSVDEIYSEYTMEHMKDIINTLKEIYRICKNKASVEIIVPHFTSHRMFGDLTHHRFFSYSSFDNFVINLKKGQNDFRNVRYCPEIKFKLIKREIGFYHKSKTSGRNTRFLIPFEIIFNLIPNVYERFFCFMIPATELRFLLEVEK